jgi:hypothetical protein
VVWLCLRSCSTLELSPQEIHCLCSHSNVQAPKYTPVIMFRVAATSSLIPSNTDTALAPSKLTVLAYAPRDHGGAHTTLSHLCNLICLANCHVHCDHRVPQLSILHNHSVKHLPCIVQSSAVGTGAHQCRHAALVGLESVLEQVHMDSSAAGTVKVERRPVGMTPGQVRCTPGRRASRAATVGGTRLGVRGFRTR